MRSSYINAWLFYTVKTCTLKLNLDIEKERKIQIMHNGLKVVAGGYHGDWMEEIIFRLKGHHEPQEERLFYEVLKTLPDNATMIELGCFWAYYSMWFQKTLINSSNYLIEPNIDKLKLGMVNFLLNNLKGKFYHGFLGKGKVEEAYAVNNLRRLEELKDQAIPSIEIDDFIEKLKIPCVNMLHADIQGAEYTMLQGCRKSIAQQKIHFFFISTHSNDLHNKCLKFLKEVGLYIINEYNLDQSYSCDGLIVASISPNTELSAVKISKLYPFEKHVYTTTSDSRKEFAKHYNYFANPYRSCKRGLNENTNGLV